MTNVVDFACPPSVEIEGQALALCARLSHVAVELAKAQTQLLQIQEDLPPEFKARMKRPLDTLDRVIKVMTAIEEARVELEDQAPALMDNMSDGSSACFYKDNTSTGVGVDGMFTRRHHCFVITNLFLARDFIALVLRRENDNDPEAMPLRRAGRSRRK